MIEMRKYVDPQIKPYHFITDIETNSSAVIRERYVEEASPFVNVQEGIHTRLESIKDIIRYSNNS